MKLQRQKLEEDDKKPGEYYVKIFYEEIDDVTFKAQEEARATAAAIAATEAALHGNDNK